MLYLIVMLLWDLGGEKLSLSKKSLLLCVWSVGMGLVRERTG